jgi:heme-degrading monooxygenase HmoA
VFAEGQVVTVFRNRLLDDPDAQARYQADAAGIAELARGMPGYVEHKGFTADDGERVTVVTFADRASHEAWRDHPEHRAAQRRGIEGYYAAYSIQVGTVSHAGARARG